MKKILYISGSPCSGKSTVAELISKEYGAYYFKVDDFLGEFLGKAAAAGKTACSAVASMSADEIWMRTPEIQCLEEFRIYDEISEFVFEALESITEDFIVTEGAAYTPEVMKQREIREYIAIVPGPAFQIEHYSKREWVPQILAGCHDKEQAFANWMQRDALFAEQVRTECAAGSIPCIVNDGSMTVDELFRNVTKLFNL